MKIRYLDELPVYMEKYNFGWDDICIVGSAVLADNGLRENGDLDIVIRPEKRKEIIKNYENELDVRPATTIKFSPDIQDTFNRYHRSGVSDENLFLNKYSYIKNNIRYARIELELNEKTKRTREKDKDDVSLFKYKDFPEFDWELFRRLQELEEIKPIAYNTISIQQNKVKNLLLNIKRILKYIKTNIINLNKKINDRNIKRNQTKKEIHDNISYLSLQSLDTPAIIWGAAIQYADEIRDDIQKKYEIIYERNITFSDTDYYKFIDDIYNTDAVESWKIGLKLHVLSMYPHCIKYILFNIPQPTFREKKRTNSYLCCEATTLKHIIRTKYKGQIPDYFNDIIIHIGDSPEHNTEIQDIINK